MSFKDRSFGYRFTKLGDEAESIFEATYPWNFERYGLNRPSIQQSSLPSFIRNTPDYLTSKGLVECQGFGRDQKAKFKKHKITDLAEWNRKFRVDFFLWDSYKQRYGWVRFTDLELSLRIDQLAAFENDGNEYFGVKAAELPMTGDWVPFDPAHQGVAVLDSDEKF